MRNVHEAMAEAIDDDRTVIRCGDCDYLAVAWVEHLDPDDPESVIPFHLDVINAGEERKVPLRFKNGRPFMIGGQPVYRTDRPAHPVLLGSSNTPKPPESCPIN